MPLLNFTKRRWLSLAALTGLCLLLLSGYIYNQNKKRIVSRSKSYTIEKEHNFKDATGIIPRVKRISILNDRSFNFGSFVIPVRQKDNFSYISLSIDFKIKNKELEMEIIRKKERLRGVIYDILIKEINNSEEFPLSDEAIKSVKGNIIRTVNEVVVNGKVTEAYLRGLLAV